MNFLDRPLAITDVETTGLDARVHEIIEIGLVVVRQSDLAVLDELDIKVRPAQIQTASAEALRINGYDQTRWLCALDLFRALENYAALTKGAVFTAHNVTFDWAFIEEGFRLTGIPHSMDYHRLDLMNVAWSKLREGKLPGLTKLNLDALCRHFDIPVEPMPHRAINGARTELAVLKKLLAV